ncbi:rhodanese-like domain-containing protein [Novosphingobium rosa]|uniref:rhodanese-like domain-containing protein n=1 Tax=Novosphingobium rosa TaxID=76978 RepID=UPI00082B4092|nr:rhodanese-like domain-containing protein [Novosphingobium rosa]
MTQASNLSISPDTFAQWLQDGAELAVVDIRAPRDIAYYGSPLFGKNVPEDVLLDQIGLYVPRKVIRTVLVDGGDDSAETFARILQGQGWTGTVALEGGFPGWVNGPHAHLSFDIPGNDFTRAVRDERGTPAFTVQELAIAREKGEDVIVIDTRTVPEFTRDHVPGAVNIPGAELLLHVSDVVPSASTHIVVSCAGLPRAILGAQTLIDAGLVNRVSYLEDGTAAWRRAGWELETGATRVYGPVTEGGRAFGRDHAARFETKTRFPDIDLATARNWAEDKDRTTYLLDVRTPEEYAAEHLEGTLPAEGGQLLGLSSRTIATRGARLVLIDDADGVRAATVAHWLSRRNFEIAILHHAFARADKKAEALA